MAVIRFAQANLRGAKVGNASLEKMMAERKVDVALVQEPYSYRYRITNMGKQKFVCVTDAAPMAAVVVCGAGVDVTMVTRHTSSHVACALVEKVTQGSWSSVPTANLKNETLAAI